MTSYNADKNQSKMTCVIMIIQNTISSRPFPQEPTREAIIIDPYLLVGHKAWDFRGMTFVINPS